MRFRGPLAQSYPAAVALVVCALIPFLLVTAGIFPLAPVISHSLGMGRGALDLTIAMSDAAYAFGTVMAVQLAVHLPGRRMLLVYVGAFAVAAVLAAWAPTAPVFVAAFVAEGLCTSLMLIAAVPALVTGWPPSRMPWTAMIMNLCIFGAVAIGPTVGGLQATAGSWRPLFWGVAVIAVLALLLAVLTFEDQAPQDPTAPWDLVALVLAGGGCAAAFFGATRLGGDVPAASLAPLLAGVAMVVALVVHQYRTPRPLMPVRQLASTFPVTGLLIALCASAAAFALMEVTLVTLQPQSTPGHTALLFLPEFGAAVATAVLFGALLRTRFTPVLAFGGLVMLAAAAATLTGVATGGDARVAVGSGLLGLGVGASVAPALFLAGFSLRSAQIQRVVALIELLRGVAAFLVAPVLLFLATTVGSTADGVHAVTALCLVLAVGGGLLAGAVFVLGRGRLQTPDLEQWMGEGEPAWDSPPVLARLRRAREHR